MQSFQTSSGFLDRLEDLAVQQDLPKEKIKLVKLYAREMLETVDQAKDYHENLGFSFETGFLTSGSIYDMEKVVLEDGQLRITPEEFLERANRWLDLAPRAGDIAVEVAYSCGFHAPGWVEPSVVKDLLESEEVPEEFSSFERAALVPVVWVDPMLGLSNADLLLLGEREGEVFAYDLKHRLGRWAENSPVALSSLLQMEAKKGLRAGGIYGAALPGQTKWLQSHFLITESPKDSVFTWARKAGALLNVLGWGIVVFVPPPFNLAGYYFVSAGTFAMVGGTVGEASEWLFLEGGERRFFRGVAQASLYVLPNLATRIFGFSKAALLVNLGSTAGVAYLQGSSNQPLDLSTALFFTFNSIGIWGRKKLPLTEETRPVSPVVHLVQEGKDGEYVLTVDSFGICKVFSPRGNLVATGYAYWEGGKLRVNLTRLTFLNVEPVIERLTDRLSKLDVPLPRASEGTGFEMTLVEKNSSILLSFDPNSETYWVQVVDPSYKVLREFNPKSLDEVVEVLKENTEGAIDEKALRTTLEQAHYFSIRLANSPWKENSLLLLQFLEEKKEPPVEPLPFTRIVVLRFSPTGNPLPTWRSVFRANKLALTAPADVTATHQPFAPSLLRRRTTRVMVFGNQREMEYLMAGLRYLFQVESNEEALEWLQQPSEMIESRLSQHPAGDRITKLLKAWETEETATNKFLSPPQRGFYLWEDDPGRTAFAGLLTLVVYFVAYRLGQRMASERPLSRTELEEEAERAAREAMQQYGWMMR